MNYLHMFIGRAWLLCLLASTVHAADRGETIAAIQAQLQANFTFVDQGDDDRPRLATGETPFSGDCDDLAFAAYGRLLRAGLVAQIWIVKYSYAPRYHMITCADGKCIDTNRDRPVPQWRLRSDYSHWRRARASEAWIERRLGQQLALRLR